MTINLKRNGQTEWNIRNLIQRCDDIGLDDLDKKQSLELKCKFIRVKFTDPKKTKNCWNKVNLKENRKI